MHAQSEDIFPVLKYESSAISLHEQVLCINTRLPKTERSSCWLPCQGVVNDDFNNDW